MKIHLKKIFLLLLLASAGLTALAKTRMIEPPAHKNLFMLKAEKEFVGAKVEVYNFSGQLITHKFAKKKDGNRS